MGALSGKRIYLVGDSWVVGAPGRALKAALQAEGAEVHLNGLVGRGAGTLAHSAGYARNARALQPDVILYLLGVNDDPRSSRLRSYYARLAEIAQRAGADAFVLPNTMYREPHLTRVAEVTAVQRQVFLDHVIDTRDLAPSVAYDGSGYHLTRAGAERWAARLMPRLLSALSGASTSALDRLGRGLLRFVPGSR